MYKFDTLELEAWYSRRIPKKAKLLIAAASSAVPLQVGGGTNRPDASDNMLDRETICRLSTSAAATLSCHEARSASRPISREYGDVGADTARHGLSGDSIEAIR